MAEKTLNLLRNNDYEYSDFEALRNILAISRIQIHRILQKHDLQTTVRKHQGLIQKACYLSILADPKSQDLLPGTQNLEVDIDTFISSTESTLTISRGYTEHIEADLEMHLDSLILYFDDSYSNVDAALSHTAANLSEHDENLLQRFRSDLDHLDYPDSLEELVELSSNFFGWYQLSKVFGQLFEANRVLFSNSEVSSKSLHQYILQQDILFNAYSEFKLTEGFNLAESPITSITPIASSTLKYLVNAPGVMQQLVGKMTTAISYTWLRSALEELFFRFQESVLENIIEVSYVFSQADDEHRNILDLSYQEHPLEYFFKNIVEIGAGGDVEIAYQALTDVVSPKYMQVVGAMLTIFPYNTLLQFEALSGLEPDSTSFKSTLMCLDQHSTDLDPKESQILDKIVSLISESSTFKKLLRDRLRSVLIIH